MLRTYVVEYSDGRKIRIKAARYRDSGSYGYSFWTSPTGSKEPDSADATVASDGVISIIPQDMLVASFEDSSMLPDISFSHAPSTDYTTDTFFSEAQKTPFSPSERIAISRALSEAKTKIHEQFSTTKEQQSEIEAKLDYLERKVKELDKFNWKRLFVTVLVGICVDLGFGTLIPPPLLDIFKTVSSHVAERLIKNSKPSDENK